MMKTTFVICLLSLFSLHGLGQQCHVSQHEARERTFIMVKPDGVQRGLVGEIIKRFEQKGLKLVALKYIWPTEELLNRHYAELNEKPFFRDLVQYVSSGPVVSMVWEGLNVVKISRLMIGATNPSNAAPGTIRADLSISTERNIIHGSDSVETAIKEIDLWFEKKELVDWHRESEKWIYEEKSC